MRVCVFLSTFYNVLSTILGCNTPESHQNNTDSRHICLRNVQRLIRLLPSYCPMYGFRHSVCNERQMVESDASTFKHLNIISYLTWRSGNAHSCMTQPCCAPSDLNYMSHHRALGWSRAMCAFLWVRTYQCVESICTLSNI